MPVKDKRATPESRRWLSVSGCPLVPKSDKVHLQQSAAPRVVTPIAHFPRRAKFARRQRIWQQLLYSRLAIQRIEELVAISVQLGVKPNQLAKLHYLPPSAGLIRE